ncbi:S-adenosylmethionine/tRNA-ribosyltransferase-isomerase [Chloroherpeton thalassium ATCC 35110]|uniref:S-adenosylmethionine:tRNA ribosyltransferase-isomerase n=1 Tax=Chloroherpeton thalassium (strain ATCC 35110 / GB-78) TaxID=517418 RepID=QUEA_CHLT3|nr:tRNA preQ1(34) S-adenosylmethionine ribosyltransferase-isomerase QueA [Chloroherpeton thalassium]B3QXK9.1 RecName: Full=S-adenosylmethionine:tRNA ribosyltransferase-isomerase; AltName: Full=Queuosine biosynthesis protein QueA [Chloroherpeton thalassium ATCC 35110]ACF14924.1 S-adenosylmethionine/tRNA-ribosyltransferase-isomerase [Chloroherpeton thalassium ATCC 35110]
MRLSDFRYTLPKTAVAEYPSEPRDSCKLMVLDRRKKTTDHKQFSDLLDYFKKGDVLVLNDTKVFPARLYGNKEKTSAKIEVFLLRELNKQAGLWDVLVEPARKVRVGNKIYFPNDLVAEVVDNTTSRGRTIRFLNPDIDIFSIVEKVGQMPIPPYIKRDPEEEDKERYQTVFARIPGAVVAPLAGLHFTNPLLKAIQDKGVEIISLTLHPGLSTFREVEVEDISKHKMDSEYYNVPYSCAKVINSIKEKKSGRVFAVGTTVCRALEANATVEGRIKFGEGWTDKYIYPPYDFKVVDALITNFHQPESTLLMLVSAFAEHDFLMKNYKLALKSDYKFLGYGDAMLIF